MTVNMGNIDRILRLVIAVVLMWLSFDGTIGGVFGVIAWVVAAVFVFSALFGFCPLYRLIGVNTCPRK